MKFGFRKALYDISKKQWIDQMYGFDTQAAGLSSFVSKPTQPKGFHLIIPMYADNENLLMFWWYASTVRHLGIGGLRTSYAWPGRGGFHPLPEERFLAYKAAVAEYQSLKRFFARGQFFGIDEYTHVHIIPDGNAAVISIFNVTQEEVRRVVEVDISQVGLESVESIDGAEGRKTDVGFLFEIQIPPMSPKLVNINV